MAPLETSLGGSLVRKCFEDVLAEHEVRPKSTNTVVSWLLTPRSSEGPSELTILKEAAGEKWNEQICGTEPHVIQSGIPVEPHPEPGTGPYLNSALPCNDSPAANKHVAALVRQVLSPIVSFDEVLSTPCLGSSCNQFASQDGAPPSTSSSAIGRAGCDSRWQLPVLPSPVAGQRTQEVLQHALERSVSSVDACIQRLPPIALDSAHSPSCRSRPACRISSPKLPAQQHPQTPQVGYTVQGSPPGTETVIPRPPPQPRASPPQMRPPVRAPLYLRMRQQFEVMEAQKQAAAMERHHVELRVHAVPAFRRSEKATAKRPKAAPGRRKRRTRLRKAADCPAPSAVHEGVDAKVNGTDLNTNSPLAVIATQPQALELQRHAVANCRRARRFKKASPAA